MATTSSDSGPNPLNPEGSCVSHHNVITVTRDRGAVNRLGNESSARLPLHRNACYGFQFLDTCVSIASRSVTSRSEQPHR